MLDSHQSVLLKIACVFFSPCFIVFSDLGWVNLSDLSDLRGACYPSVKPVSSMHLLFDLHDITKFKRLRWILCASRFLWHMHRSGHQWKCYCRMSQWLGSYIAPKYLVKGTNEVGVNKLGKTCGSMKIILPKPQDAAYIQGSEKTCPGFELSCSRDKSGRLPTGDIIYELGSSGKSPKKWWHVSAKKSFVKMDIFTNVWVKPFPTFPHSQTALWWNKKDVKGWLTTECHLFLESEDSWISYHRWK